MQFEDVGVHRAGEIVEEREDGEGDPGLWARDAGEGVQIDGVEGGDGDVEGEEDGGEDHEVSEAKGGGEMGKMVRK